MFTKILLPVGFNRNTRWSVDKAIQLANKFGCDIVLFHAVQNGSDLSWQQFAFWKKGRNKKEESERCRQMNEVETYTRSKLNEGLLVTSILRKGTWQTELKNVMISEHIDLALIPRSHRRLNKALISRININSLSQQTNCPVLTVTRRFNVNQLQSIVVPVKDQLPVKKLIMAMYVSMETSSSIYLMGIDEKLPAGKEGLLLRSYQLLNGFGKLSVQCALRDDPDMAASTLAYARDVHAGMIVISPGQESRLRGWWNKLKGKYLCRESDIPVMTVAI